MKDLSPKEIENLVSLLSRFKPGLLPFPVFVQIACLVALPTINLVPLRKSPNGKIEVLLTPRISSDIHWPSLLHVPGTVIRASDSARSYQDAFNRIIKDELAGLLMSQPVFCFNSLEKDLRGLESTAIYFAEIIGQPTIGKFYPIDSLPKDMIMGQIPFIVKAAKCFSDLESKNGKH